MNLRPTDHLEVRADRGTFLELQNGDAVLKLDPPVFELNQTLISDFVFDFTHKTETGWELHYQSQKLPELRLTVFLSKKSKDSVLRFRYVLQAESCVQMTKSFGTNQPCYFSCRSMDLHAVWYELQFAQYLPQIHSFVPRREEIGSIGECFGKVFPGPVVECDTGKNSVLMAYEHGAEYPNHYLHFEMDGDTVSLKGTKGNYYDGQKIEPGSDWKSCWFQIGLGTQSLTELHKEYRGFAENLALSRESRKPYLFYNTWNYQERDRNFKRQPYLSRLTLEKVLKEIDVAHQMGIEVFVIDTGWYQKTGDWEVNEAKFPDGLEQIRAKLNAYGMKLGLWFNPTVAAKTSQIVKEHPEYRMELDGKRECNPVWETEESYGMCLCSDYADWFANKLISLYHQLGVRYFKWDGISQFGCDCSHHHHGTEANSPQERQDCYSYQMGLKMIDVVEQLTAACPDVIVDFDVTEAGRFVGLGFLSAGKYFLVNNGPYAKDFDLPAEFSYMQPHPIYLEPFTNLFFYPGSARPRICRTGIQYDFLVPSQLFLTHYLPDGDENARENSLASLVLGGNGIWGDLESLTEEEKQFWKTALNAYKRVREDAVSVPARISGCTGSSPETYEKINPETGRGFIALFTCQKTECCYDTIPLKQMPKQIIGAKQYEVLPNGAVRIEVVLNQDGAKVIFFD